MQASIRKIVGANLARLMEHRPMLGSRMAIERATAQAGTKVGKSTVDRLLAGDTPINIDYIESIAAVFGIEPWQLLVPNIEPKNLPALSVAGEGQAALVKEVLEFARKIVAMEEAGSSHQDMSTRPIMTGLGGVFQASPMRHDDDEENEQKRDAK